MAVDLGIAARRMWRRCCRVWFACLVRGGSQRGPGTAAHMYCPLFFTAAARGSFAEGGGRMQG
jgi:hypothetical protein